jgi:hypothetical protein
MKTLRNLIVLGLMATTFACGEKDDGCEGQKDIYHYLSQDAKSKIPYTGIDTLRFVSNTGDTAICIGQGKQVTYDSQFNQGVTCNWYEQYEVNSTSYVGDLNIEISHSKRIEAIRFKIDLFEFGIFNYHVGRTDISTYLDSIVIDNKTYLHVHKLENREYSNLYIIYNRQDGIIQINSTNNKSWNRL